MAKKLSSKTNPKTSAISKSTTKSVANAHKMNSVAPDQLREYAKLMHPAFCNSIGYCLVKSGYILRALLDRALANCQIISPQFAILAILAESGSMSQIEIGTVLGIDKATMVKLIDALEDQKCVTRLSDKVDRRVKRVQITAAGKRLREKGLELRGGLEKEILSNLSPADRAQLEALLPKVLDQLRTMAMK